MISKNKIRLMAKAAAYESEKLREDGFARRYYKQDYVSLMELKMRIWATVFYVVYWIYAIVKEFYIEGTDLLRYDYAGLFVRIIVLYIIVLLAVSLFAGFIHGIRFESAKRRVDDYYNLLAEINDYDNIDS